MKKFLIVLLIAGLISASFAETAEEDEVFEEQIELERQEQGDATSQEADGTQQGTDTTTDNTGGSKTSEELSSKMNIDVATIADFEKPNSNFELLNNATFDEFIGKSNFSLVFVYATWDGNSKKVLKELEKMADHIDKTKVDLGKIDGYTYESLQGRFDIQYFPQVFFFKKGELVFRYGGYRKSAKEFEELVTKNQYPEVEIVNSIDEIKEIRKNWNVTIGIFNDTKGVEEYANLAEHFYYSSIRFLLLFETKKDNVKKITEEIQITLKTDNFPFILYSPIGDYGVDISNEDIQDFDRFGTISYNLRLPTFTMIDEEDFLPYRDTELPLFWFLLDPTNPNHNKTVEMIKKEVGKYRGEAVAFYLDYFENMYQCKLLNMDVERSHLPSFTIYMNDQDQTQYMFDSSIPMTAKRLGEFLEKWKRNELEEFLIYEKDGKEYDVDKDGNLMAHCNLFGNTIMKAINDQEISHFIYFNSPNCDHCEFFNPVFEKVAKTMKEKNKKLRLCQINIEENKVPKTVPLIGFPTLALFRPGEEIMFFKGKRTEENLVDFLTNPTVETSEKGAGEDQPDEVASNNYSKNMAKKFQAETNESDKIEDEKKTDDSMENKPNPESINTNEKTKINAPSAEQNAKKEL